MARIITTLGGRLGSSTAQGIDLGPTGQFAWGASTAVSPQLIHQLSTVYTGETQSFTGIFSVWFFVPSSTLTDVNHFLKFESSTGIHVFSEFGFSGGFPTIRLRDDSKTLIADVDATVQATPSTWQHLLIGWDLNVGSLYASEFHMYLDDVDVKEATPGAFTTGSMVDWGTGNLFTTTYRMGVVDTQAQAPGTRFAAWYLNTDEYLDFSVEANRRKFRDASGNPTALGVDGSLPTGNQPPFYFDDPAATVINNRGSAGAFLAGATIVDAVGPNP